MKVHGIQPDAVRANEQKARELMGRLEALLSSSSSSSSEKGQGPWLFGLEQPTALDAHVVILLGRLQDVGRTSLVSERLLEYTDAAFQTPKLQTVMAGRRTMAPMQ
jgi:glutathione S-transferase